MHKGVQHVGKTPAKWHAPNLLAAEPEPPANRLEDLHHSLKLAVDGEQYEEAARIRDEIKREESS